MSNVKSYYQIGYLLKNIKLRWTHYNETINRYYPLNGIQPLPLFSMIIYRDLSIIFLLIQYNELSFILITLNKWGFARVLNML